MSTTTPASTPLEIEQKEAAAYNALIRALEQEGFRGKSHEARWNVKFVSSEGRFKYINKRNIHDKFSDVKDVIAYMRTKEKEKEKGKESGEERKRSRSGPSSSSGSFFICCLWSSSFCHATCM